MEKKLWARAKWLEGKVVRDDAIPANWVDAEKMIVYWPRKNQNKCIAEHTSPKSDWKQFTLLAKKLEHDEEQVCVDYNFTTEGESESDSNETNALRMKSIPSSHETSGIPNDCNGSKKDLPIPPTPLNDKPSSTASLSLLSSYPETWGKKVTPSRSTNLPQTPPTVNDKTNAKQPVSSFQDLPKTPPLANNKNNSNDKHTVSQSTPRESDLSQTIQRGSRKFLKRAIARKTGDSEDFAVASSSKQVHLDAEADKLLADESLGITEDEILNNSRQILKYAKKSFRLLVEMQNILQEQANVSVTDGQTLFDKAESIEDVRELEEIFFDQQKRKELVSYLQGIGGSDFKDHTKSVMKKLFSNNVMSQMNMLGGGNGEKFAFSKSNLYEIVIDTVKVRHKAVTESEIRKAVQDFLRNAPARCANNK